MKLRIADGLAASGLLLSFLLVGCTKEPPDSKQVLNDLVKYISTHNAYRNDVIQSADSLKCDVYRSGGEDLGWNCSATVTVKFTDLGLANTTVEQLGYGNDRKFLNDGEVTPFNFELARAVITELRPQTLTKDVGVVQTYLSCAGKNNAKTCAVTLVYSNKENNKRTIRLTVGLSRPAGTWSATIIPALSGRWQNGNKIIQDASLNNFRLQDNGATSGFHVDYFNFGVMKYRATYIHQGLAGFDKPYGAQSQCRFEMKTLVDLTFSDCGYLPDLEGTWHQG